MKKGTFLYPHSVDIWKKIEQGVSHMAHGADPGLAGLLSSQSPVSAVNLFFVFFHFSNMPFGFFVSHNQQSFSLLDFIQGCFTFGEVLLPSHNTLPPFQVVSKCQSRFSQLQCFLFFVFLWLHYGLDSVVFHQKKKKLQELR